MQTGSYTVFRAKLTSAAVRLNIAFLVNTLETFYWYQRTEDACANEAIVNIRLAPGEVVRTRRSRPPTSVPVNLVPRTRASLHVRLLWRAFPLAIW